MEPRSFDESKRLFMDSLAEIRTLQAKIALQHNQMNFWAQHVTEEQVTAAQLDRTRGDMEAYVVALFEAYSKSPSPLPSIEL